jgi:hypothetical protein
MEGIGTRSSLTFCPYLPCPAYLEFGGLVFASLGLKPPSAFGASTIIRSISQRGAPTWLNFAPLSSMTSQACHAGLPFVGTTMKNPSGCPMRGCMEKIDEYQLQLHQIGRQHLSGGLNRYPSLRCPPHRFSPSLLQTR